MSKKKIITCSLLILLAILSISGIYYFKNKDYNTKKIINSNLTIIINNNGTETSSSSIPIGSYILNEEKTICENGGTVKKYIPSLGKISFSFLGSDRCTLYFDKVEDNEPPVISNLQSNGTTVSVDLEDNLFVSYIAICETYDFDSCSYWTDVNEKKASLSVTDDELGFTIDDNTRYYLYACDCEDNCSMSSFYLGNKGYETILLNNGNGTTTVEDAKSYIEGKGTPDFHLFATTNEGMYAVEDDIGTSYYFRGAVNNNWVKFGKNSSGNNIYWRIIRINGDGSIRMIYSGTTAPTSSTSIVMTGEGTQIGTSEYTNNVIQNGYIYSYYAGYMYAADTQHGLTNDSIIKTSIDDWYKTTTLETDKETKYLVAEGIFCNDRNVTTGTFSAGFVNSFNYSGYDRLKNYTPTLNCTIDSDKFTVGSSNGNGALTYPVGLITADEISIAGGRYGGMNTSFYLYTNENFWTMTPFGVGTDHRTYSFSFYSNGNLNPMYVNASFGIRPVINLSAGVILSGDGTYNNVYTVS